jgi:two-component system cell cycle sensor histidine kinase/response regulator CckA
VEGALAFARAAAFVKGASVWTRLVLGFLVVIGLTVAVGAVSWSSQQRALAAFDQYLRLDDRIADLSLHCSIGIMKARKYERDFLLKEREFGFEEARSRYATLVQAELAEIRQAMSTIRDLRPDADLVAASRRVEEAAFMYEAGFMRVVALHGLLGRADTGLEGQFRRSAHQMEALLDARGEERLARELLTLRRREKDFLLRGREVDAQRFAAEHARFVEDVRSSALRPGDRRAVAPLARSYGDVFAEYVQVSSQLRPETARYLGAARDVEALLDDLHARAAASSLRTRRSVHDLTLATGWTIAAGSLLAALAGFAVALLVSRGIARSVRGCARFADQIAQGDLTTRLAPAGERELRGLGASLNAMADALSAGRALREREERELIEANRVLAERTAQLASANESLTVEVAERRAARAAAERAAIILADLHDAVVGFTSDFAIDTWNHAAERLFGWSREEVLGRKFPDVVLTEHLDGETHDSIAARVARDGRAQYHARRRTRSGEWISVEATALALRGPAGELLGYVSVSRDISARLRAEAALRASQERLVRILETATEGICLVDAGGRTEFANQRMSQMLGCDDLVGRPFLDLLPAGVRRGARADARRLRRGEKVQRELKVTGRSGAELELAASATALSAPDGSYAGIVAVFTDVTVHRRAAQQLLHSQKMDAVGRLASGVAHDFNNVLAVVLSCSDFLLGDLPEGEHREEVEEIQRAGQRAARLVAQLLAFSRKSVFQPVRTDLNTVVLGIEKLVRRSVPESIEVALRLAQDPWPLRIDTGHLEQVVLNLVVNARDAMGDGGRLRIETANEEVPRHGGGGATDRCVVLRVADDGCGMTPEVVSRIFEPFFTTKEKGKGTGLGLSTVFGIVQQAGGNVAVASRPGEGSTFTVSFPVDGGAGSAAAEAAPRPTLARADATVLLVEDEDGVRRSASRLLARHGLRVVEARDGAEALLRFAERPVDVVLTDLVMPGMSGPELAAKLQRGAPALPVVFMTGYSDHRSAWDADALVLAKPFTEATLLAKIAEALARQPGREQRVA